MKKVLILSESTSASFFDQAARELGYVPIFIYSSDKVDIDTKYPYFIIDFFKSPQIIANEITEKFGKIYGIVSCIEQLTYHVGEVAKLLNIAVNSLESYLILRDKRAMKKCWIDHNVSTAKLIGTYSSANINYSSLKFPLIVKPTFGAASAGVKIVANEVEMKEQVRNITRFNVTTLSKENATKSGYIIEQYITGNEYSVDTVWINEQPVINGIMSKGNPTGPHFPDRLYYTETNLDEKTKELILSEVYRGVHSAGVINGATHTELRVMEGKVYLIEAALRAGAGGALYQIFQESTGLPYYKYLIMSYIPECIKSFKGETLDFIPKKNRFWYNAGYKGSGRIKALSVATNFLENNKNVEKIYFRKKVGDFLPKEGETLAYLAWVIGNFTVDMIGDNKKIDKFLDMLDDILIIDFE
jgi:biotin carboxylase